MCTKKSGRLQLVKKNRKINSICSLFLRKGGFKICTVTGSHLYSRDWIQGGLEIP